MENVIPEVNLKNKQTNPLINADDDQQESEKSSGFNSFFFFFFAAVSRMCVVFQSMDLAWGFFLEERSPTQSLVIEQKQT